MPNTNSNNMPPSPAPTAPGPEPPISPRPIDTPNTTDAEPTPSEPESTPPTDTTEREDCSICHSPPSPAWAIHLSPCNHICDLPCFGEWVAECDDTLKTVVTCPDPGCGVPVTHFEPASSVAVNAATFMPVVRESLKKKEEEEARAPSGETWNVTVTLHGDANNVQGGSDEVARIFADQLMELLDQMFEERVPPEQIVIEYNDSLDAHES